MGRGEGGRLKHTFKSLFFTNISNSSPNKIQNTRKTNKSRFEIFF
uniref:Uncharacterized protein n=1 Tax=Anguilla anguilla TaxID=7936 RepID=A0A0E9W3X3_ANGAN